MGLDRRGPSGTRRPSGGGMGSGYVAPSQALMPTVIKWLLQFEDRHQTLWLGKALPRVWLEAGSPPIAVERSPSSFGRLSFSLHATDASTVVANISVPRVLAREGEHHAIAAAFDWPRGGIKLRIRHPSKTLHSATVGGVSWGHINKTEETIVFAAAMHDTSVMQHIVATFQ
jgi:hypothetical protein